MANLSPEVLEIAQECFGDLRILEFWAFCVTIVWDFA